MITPSLYFASAHAALLELFAATARARVVPSHLRLPTQKRQWLPFPRIISRLCWRSLRWHGRLRRCKEKGAHLLHPLLLLGSLHRNLPLPDRVFGEGHANDRADDNQLSHQVAAYGIIRPALYHLTHGLDSLVGKLPKDSIGQAGPDAQLFFSPLLPPLRIGLGNARQCFAQSFPGWAGDPYLRLDAAVFGIPVHIVQDWPEQRRSLPVAFP